MVSFRCFVFASQTNRCASDIGKKRNGKHIFHLSRVHVSEWVSEFDVFVSVIIKLTQAFPCDYCIHLKFFALCGIQVAPAFFFSFATATIFRHIPENIVIRTLRAFLSVVVAKSILKFWHRFRSFVFLFVLYWATRSVVIISYLQVRYCAHFKVKESRACALDERVFGRSVGNPKQCHKLISIFLHPSGACLAVLVRAWDE